MNKEDFKRAVQERLLKVPPETRKQWNDTDLLVWWANARVEDSYLTWERCPGDVWQWVKGMCGNLIGKDAIC